MERRGAALGTGHTRAKFILMGEHSVVYGHSAIALPLPALSMDVEVHAVGGAARIRSEYFSGPLADAPSTLAGPIAAINAASGAFDVPLDGLLIDIESSIPAERGLGSSAAAAGALVHAFADMAHRRISDREHYDLVQVAERVAHGTPSGLDAVATNSRVPVLFAGGITAALPMTLQGSFVIADTGVRGRTRVAVAGLRRLREERPVWAESRLDRLGRLAEDAVADLAEARGEALGVRMSEAHGILSELGVSSRELDVLVTAATAAGALGAKLTGGGQGGCVVALAPTPAIAADVTRALHVAGATRSWVYDTMVPVT
ncbi:mevalonate kinase [Labedella populi]|uniref:Mevalonate kinase n=1 Tax=Labedella populi TaxID=2498850 RepID=A0A3S3ZNT5_9MICO|nr:mevalonate kinase [Labedella populi]RWZ61183.1 mevalonate kinase [Labedella populi]